VRLSLAVAAKGACDASGFFDALGANATFAAADIDIHIAHDGAFASDAGRRRPNIHFHACAAGTSMSRLWALAIACSASDYIAVLDIQAPPAPGWLARVQIEITKGTPLFFGPVEPGWHWSDPRIVGYLIEYGQFGSPVPSNLGEVPGNNFIFHRRLCSSDEMRSSGFFKTFMIWRIERELGLTPQAFNDMPVTYRKVFSLRRYLATRIAQGRSFSARRHEHPGQPSKLLCIGFTPFLPFLRVWRIFRAARHMHRRAALRYLHLIILSEAAWSLGEFLGYVAGEQSSIE
jgi:hypothetical protein